MITERVSEFTEEKKEITNFLQNNKNTKENVKKIQVVEPKLKTQNPSQSLDDLILRLKSTSPQAEKFKETLDSIKVLYDSDKAIQKQISS